MQKVRSNNDGLVLLVQSLTGFDEEILPTSPGSVGCRALFGGSSPEDAKIFSDLWGTEQRADVTYSVSRSSTWSTSVSISESTSYESGPLGFGQVPTGTSTGSTVGHSSGGGVSAGQSKRMVETAIWSPGELVNQIPPRHCILSLSSSTGARTPPLMIDMGA